MKKTYVQPELDIRPIILTEPVSASGDPDNEYDTSLWQNP